MRATSARALDSLGMVFLVPVLVSAVFYGRRTAFVTAILSVLSYNFFFLPPLYTFTIADPNNLLQFAVLLFVAIIAGNLAARVQAQADLATARATAMTELYRFTGKLAGIARLDDILWTASVQIASMLKTNVVILLPNPITKNPEVRAGFPPEDELDDQDLAAAAWSWSHALPAGRNSETLPGAKRLFFPCGPAKARSAWPACSAAMTGPCSRQTKDGCWTPCWIKPRWPLNGQKLVEQADQALVIAEADKLRVAMLTSLSHDLRDAAGRHTGIRDHADFR